MDLSEYSTVFAGDILQIRFDGTKTDGKLVRATFLLDGIIDGAGPINDFQTFYFDSSFTDLATVSLYSRFQGEPTYIGWNQGAMDKLVVSIVPEPGSMGLLIFSLAFTRIRVFRNSTGMQKTR